MVVITICFKPLSYTWDYSSAGEHLVDIEGVTGSIPVSPTISTKIKYVRNNKGLACKPLKLLGYFYYESLKHTYLIPNTFLKNSQKIGIFTLQIVCKSLLDFFQLIPKHNRVQRVRSKNSLEKIIFKFNNM